MSIQTKFNIIVIPYRDLYFLDKYGFTVRDLMVVKALSENENVIRTVVINRPVSVYERILGKRMNRLTSPTHNKIEFIDTTSFDLLGPLRKRKWTEHCYDKVCKLIDGLCDKDDGVVNILLDFTPLAKIDYSVFEKNGLIWYDLIDNFKKHNRYDKLERELVGEKYEYVNKIASLITGVTNESVSQFSNEKIMVINNGLLRSIKVPDFPTKPEYAFGFIGFVTDKIDTKFLHALADKAGEKIVIYGEIYSKKTAKDLARNSQIYVAGGFHSNDVREIVKTFEIGLIPYKTQASHDGSPLKLYQYISYGKPVVSSERYDEELSRNEYVLTDMDCNVQNIVGFLAKMRNKFHNNKNGFASCVAHNIKDEYMWDNKVRLVLEKLSNSANQCSIDVRV